MPNSHASIAHNYHWIVLRGHRFEGFTDEGARVLRWANRILAERDELLADVERMRGRLSVVAVG
jgi:DNA-binding transcriptional LysR family regulator